MRTPRLHNSWPMLFHLNAYPHTLYHLPHIILKQIPDIFLMCLKCMGSDKICTAGLCPGVFNVCTSGVFCALFGFLLFSPHRFLTQEPLSSSLPHLPLSSLPVRLPEARASRHPEDLRTRWLRSGPRLLTAKRC